MSLTTGPDGGGKYPSGSNLAKSVQTGSAEIVGARRAKLRRFLQDRAALASGLGLLLIGFVALTAPWIAPYEPLSQNLSNALAFPSGEHLLGTDNLGRDVLSRLIFGSRISLAASFIAVGVALAIGLPIGLLSGYVRGWIDAVLMRTTDAFMSLPNIILVIAIVAVLGNTLTNAMVALGLVFAPTFIRLVRGEVLAVREELYIDAARALGLRNIVIVLRHVLPNVVSPVIVQVSIMMGLALILEAGLSFIGLGVQPPNASWGSMLSTAADFLDRHPYLLFPPGVAITLTVLALNLLGDGIRDAVGRALESTAPNRPRRAEAVEMPWDGVAADRQVETAGTDELPTWPADLLLRVRDLTVEFPGPGGRPVQVLSSVDLDIRVGEVVGLVGESGSGKTMTALSIMQLLPPPGQQTRGAVELGGQELSMLAESRLRDLRGDEIALISQEPMSSLNPAFTIGDQLIEAIRAHNSVRRSTARVRAVELLERVGIAGAKSRLRDYPHQFSGGMAQRVMIAMALSCQPRLLIADEPTTALDVTVQSDVLELLRGLQHEFGMAVLFVTHDLGVVADICDRAVVMYAGQIVEVAAVDDLFERPQHPYTEGLLRSLPQTAIQTGSLYRIPGTVPTPHAWPPGCRFEPRCPYAIEACSDRPVPAFPAPAQGMVRCIRAHELDLQGTT